ncbi:uncharacterized protein isoform X2 [Rhodnius prolixus]|uniref:uncharacterized protein isoform X2 n=1 Tax=Rhodnius prolixus TaxID=13249 RepID=UPI003D18A97E
MFNLILDVCFMLFISGDSNLQTESNEAITTSVRAITFPNNKAIVKLRNAERKILYKGAKSLIEAKLLIVDETLKISLQKGKKAKECVEDLGLMYLQKLGTNAYHYLFTSFTKCIEIMKDVLVNTSSEHLKKVMKDVASNGSFYKELDNAFTLMDRKNKEQLEKFKEDVKNCYQLTELKKNNKL